MDETIKKWRPPKRSLRALTGEEAARLAAQGNRAGDWGRVRVAAEGFDAGRVHGCGFDGDVEIGAFKAGYSTKYGNLELKTGLYGSYFRDTSIGDNAAIHNLLYCREQDIGDSVVISNVGEISSGISQRDVDICPNTINIINENGGRAITPFPGMTCTDAYIWARFRGDRELMDKLSAISQENRRDSFTERTIIANNAAIINTKTIRNTHIGPYTFIDGAELIYNSTIMSEFKIRTFIGAAVQIRDSIIGYENDIDSAAQLSNAMTGTAVSVSKAARIAHSFIGDCSHVACCEIANCLIMPSHAQHHNNSFLIAACAGGQSNVAAGATIGSNHNSRTCDGEIWAARGFWPGLCVSLKHNSRFASFTMIAKGTYPNELDIRLPFSLVALDRDTGAATITPAFWFTRNMYAAMRSAQKFVRRDTRTRRQQYIEHDILAPDTVEEMFEAIDIVKSGSTAIEKGAAEVRLARAGDASEMYRLMIRHYCAKNILPYMRDNHLGIDGLLRALGPLTGGGGKWLNCGSTVISEAALAEIIGDIKAKAKTWGDVHALFDSWAAGYPAEKVRHALLSLARLEGVNPKALCANDLTAFLKSVPEDCETIKALTASSRSKDFDDPFRAMVYASEEEMEAVLGPREDSVIRRTAEEMDRLASLAGEFLP